MDEDNGRKRKRYRDLSEDEKKMHINSVLSGLRYFLQKISSPAKKNKMEKSQETPNWTPSFQNYEDFIQKTLQSLDGFMLIVSIDGIIVSVGPRITSLLGHLPNDIVGKSFLSLLPDDEKSKIFSKMAFRTAVSNSVGKHIDFCCHFKRGEAESDNTSAYEYVKVILTLKDVSYEHPALFHSFSTPVCGPSTVNLPLDDAFYLVGTICVLSARTLQGFFRTNGPSPLVPNLGEDELSEDHRLIQEETGCFGMESSEVEITDVEEPANAIETELSESSDSMDSFNVNPVMSDDFNTVSPLPSIPASSEMYSRQSFESELGMGHVTHVYELNHVHKVSVMDHTEESDKDVHENQEDQEYEENHEEVQKDWKDQENKKDQEDEEGQKEQEYQPLQLSPHITSYLKSQEEMMKKFQEQLNEKIQLLNTELKKQRSSLETLKEQLQERNNSKPQALPSIVGRVLSPDLLEPAPEKPRSEAMTSPFSDISEATSVSGSCLPGSSQIHEELQQTFDTSSQVPIQEEVNQEQQQQLQQQQQQLLPLPEQPQQCNTTRENQEILFPEDHHQPHMNLFPVTHGPGSHDIYSTNLPQTTITHNPQLVTLETPQDYICLWQEPQDSQSHLYQAVQMSNWSPNEQATLGQTICTQQVAPTEQVQHSSELGTVQAGNNGLNELNSCMSSQQSHLNL
ncbi:circadian clock protein PASD1 isoform X1 [Bos javanicus]|uniref:circadian clock protein PASD1 isoform X1 n=1 Tax=Bos javanicus TaxID=9906 RepID=UPI002AA6997E|nr:circadian clock protein PASD1 isoform X1 [Bos javanicus]XP_061264725.1 circadian clock protein PASD1 isoform X1 [Bos javanicus]